MNRIFPYDVIVAQHDFRRHAVTLIRSGRVVKSFSTQYPLDVQVLPDGGVLCTGDGAAIRLDSEFRETWRYFPGRNGILSAQRLADGRIVIGDMSRSRIAFIDEAKNMTSQFDFPLVNHPDEYYLGFRMLRIFDDRYIAVAAHQAQRLLVCDFSGIVQHNIELAGMPYQPLQLADGEIWVSLGPSGKIARLDREFKILGDYDMVADSKLECGWIAGLSETPAGTVVYSDSRFDRLVEIDRQGLVVSVFQDRNELLHPSTCAVMTGRK